MNYDKLTNQNNGRPQKEEPDKNRAPKAIFVAIAAYGALKLLGGVWPYLTELVYKVRAEVGTAAYSVGVIGGADGPTAVFVTGEEWTTYLFAALCLVAGIVGFIRVSRK